MIVPCANKAEPSARVSKFVSQYIGRKFSSGSDASILDSLFMMYKEGINRARLVLVQLAPTVWVLEACAKVFCFDAYHLTDKYQVSIL